jgi:hypothetical protein
MGIKDLCKNLTYIDGISSVDLNKITRNSIIFYDFGGLFYSILSVSVSDEDFLHNLTRSINQKNEYLLKEKVLAIYFVDSGHIKIKEAERAKRSKTISESSNKYVNQVFAEKRQSSVMRTCLERLGSNHDNTFNLNLTDHFKDDDWNRYIDQITKYDHVFIKVNNFDAEFGCVMVAKEFYRYLTIWPIMLSHDQDTIGLSVFNQPKDQEVPIIYKYEYKIVKSSRRTRLITFLTLMMNGSEYVKPLSGISCTPTFIDKINWSYYDSDEWFDFDMTKDVKTIQSCLVHMIREIYQIKLGTFLVSFNSNDTNIIYSVVDKTLKYLSLDITFFSG